MRWFYLLLVCLFTPAILYAQGNKGTLKGRVTLEDGTPCGYARIDVRAGHLTYQITASKDGTFSTQVSPGDLVAEVADQKIPVHVEAGKLSDLSIVLKPDHGVILDVAYPDGTPVTIGHVRQRGVTTGGQWKILVAKYYTRSHRRRRYIVGD